MDKLNEYVAKNIERKNFEFRAGDIAAVSLKFKEGGKDKISVFEGMVLKRSHGWEPGATFTVRKIVGGVGVERTFPLYSPLIENVKVLKSYKTRRAKLYYLRTARGKRAKLKEIKSLA